MMIIKDGLEPMKVTTVRGFCSFRLRLYCSTLVLHRKILLLTQVIRSSLTVEVNFKLQSYTTMEDINMQQPSLQPAISSKKRSAEEYMKP